MKLRQALKIQRNHYGRPIDENGPIASPYTGHQLFTSHRRLKKFNHRAFKLGAKSFFTRRVRLKVYPSTAYGLLAP